MSNARFSITLTDDQSGGSLHDIARPATLTYTPTVDDLALAGGDLARLRPGIWTGTAWAPLSCTTVAGSLKCTLDHLSLFSVMIVPGGDSQAGNADRDIPAGHFYTQAGGFGPASGLGYAVVDDANAAFWTEFQRYGGVDVLGYPVSARFEFGGYQTQAFQRLALQWRPELNQAVPVNVLDELNRRGSDPWLDDFRQVPPAADTGPDASLTFEQIVARHVALLDAYPPLRDYYLGAPDALNTFGLPLSVKDYGPFVSVRLQRATLQLWKVDTAWAVAGAVVPGNAADVAKEAGLWPLSALAPSAE